MTNLKELKKEELREIQGGILFMGACAIGLAVLYLAGTVAAFAQGCNPHTGRKL